MALKKTVATVYGIEVEDAYHRVEGVMLVAKDKIQFQLRSSIDGLKPHFSDARFECSYALDGENPIAQAYAHVKSQAEFADAKDC